MFSRLLPLMAVLCLLLCPSWSGPTQVKEAPGSEDLDRRIHGLDSLLDVLGPRTVMRMTHGDHNHLIGHKTPIKVDTKDVTESGLRMAVQSVGSANEAFEAEKDTKAAVEQLEVAEKTLRSLGVVSERHRRSETVENDTGLADKIGDLDSIMNELYTGELEEALVDSEELLEVPINLSSKEYEWLLQEYNLTKEDIAGVSALSEEEFFNLLYTLEQQEAEDAEGASMTELLTMLRSLPRQLVPQEMEAAAQGMLEMTQHMGDRIWQGVKPAVDLVRLQVLPQAGLGLSAGVRRVVETVPEEVRRWVGERGMVAVRQAKQVADYAGPRLAELGEAVEKLQDQVRKETEKNVMPALEELMKEVRQTIATAQEVVPPMMELVGQEMSGLLETLEETSRPVYHQIRDRVQPAANTVYDVVVDPVSRSGNQLYHGSVGPLLEGLGELYEENVGPAVGELGGFYQETLEPVVGQLAVRSGKLMRDKVMPVVEQVGEEARQQMTVMGDTIKTDVAPTVKEFMKSTLDGVFRGVPSMVQQISHESHNAAKVFKEKYSAVLDKMRSNEHAPTLPSTLYPLGRGVKRPSKRPKRQYPTSTEL